MDSFSVTQQDIDQGTRGDPRKCPITKAAQRHFSFIQGTIFCHPIRTVSFVLDDHSILALKGRGVDLEKWLDDFDAGESVDPMTIEIDDNLVRPVGMAQIVLDTTL